jgi:hypothetical protein
VPSANYAKLKVAEMRVEEGNVAKAVAAFTKSPTKGMSDRAVNTATLAVVLAEAVRFECIQARVREALWPLVSVDNVNQRLPFSVDDLAITNPGDAYYNTLAQATNAKLPLKYVTVVNVRSNWDKVATFNLEQGWLFYVGVTNTQVAQAQLAGRITGTSLQQPTGRRRSVPRRRRGNAASASGADPGAPVLPAAGSGCTAVSGPRCAANAA